MTVTDKTPRERMVEGFATFDHDEQRRVRVAQGFRPDARMERLLWLRDNDPETYEQLDVTTRVSLGHYVVARTAAGYEPDEDGDAA